MVKKLSTNEITKVHFIVKYKHLSLKDYTNQTRGDPISYNKYSNSELKFVFKNAYVYRIDGIITYYYYSQIYNVYTIKKYGRQF